MGWFPKACACSSRDRLHGSGKDTGEFCPGVGVAHIAGSILAVRFSNRPFRVNRFQTIHHCSVGVRPRARVSLQNQHHGSVSIGRDQPNRRNIALRRRDDANDALTKRPRSCDGPASGDAGCRTARSTSTAKSGRFSTSFLMRASNFTVPTIPTLRPKLRSMAMAFDCGSLRWVMYGRCPRCKRNLTISEAFGCGHVFGLCWRLEGLPVSRCSRYGRWPLRAISGALNGWVVTFGRCPHRASPAWPGKPSWTCLASTSVRLFLAPKDPVRPDGGVIRRGDPERFDRRSTGYA